MNRFKNLFGSILFFTILLVSNNSLASNLDEIKTYPLQTIDSLKKGWIFEFNDAINPVTVNTNNIYIEDRDGKRLDISVATGASSGRSDTLIIYPNETYKNYCQYTLHIDRNLSSDDNEFLDRSIELPFKVELSDKKLPYWTKQLIYTALSNRNRHLDFSSLKVDYKEARKLIDEVIDESPEILYYDHDRIYFNTDTKLVSEIKFYYSESSLTKTKHETDLNSFAEKIVSSTKNTLTSDVEKINTYYSYILDRSKLSTRFGNSINAYGALIEKRACCSGYTKALQLLLKKSGFETKIIKGYGQEQAHMWLAVKINDEWRYFDPAWDDSNLVDQPYNYFMLDEKTILKDHTPVTSFNTVYEIHDDNEKNISYIENIELEFYESNIYDEYESE